jgi:hypothetical protein
LLETIVAVVSGNNDIDVEPSGGTFDIHTEVILLQFIVFLLFISQSYFLEFISLVRFLEESEAIEADFKIVSLRRWIWELFIGSCSLWEQQETKTVGFSIQQTTKVDFSIEPDVLIDSFFGERNEVQFKWGIGEFSSPFEILIIGCFRVFLRRFGINVPHVFIVSANRISQPTIFL